MMLVFFSFNSWRFVSPPAASILTSSVPFQTQNQDSRLSSLCVEQESLEGSKNIVSALGNVVLV